MENVKQTKGFFIEESLSPRAELATMVVVSAVSLAIVAKLYRAGTRGKQLFYNLSAAAAVSYASPWFLARSLELVRMVRAKDIEPPKEPNPNAAAEKITLLQNSLEGLARQNDTNGWQIYDQNIGELLTLRPQVGYDNPFGGKWNLLQTTLTLIDKLDNNEELHLRADRLMDELFEISRFETDPTRAALLDLHCSAAYEKYLVTARPDEYLALTQGVNEALNLMQMKETSQDEFDRADSFVQGQLAQLSGMLDKLPDESEARAELEEFRTSAQEEYKSATDAMVETLFVDDYAETRDSIVDNLLALNHYLGSQSTDSSIQDLIEGFLRGRSDCHELIADARKELTQREPDCKRTHELSYNIDQMELVLFGFEHEVLKKLCTDPVEPNAVQRAIPALPKEFEQLTNQISLMESFALGGNLEAVKKYFLGIMETHKKLQGNKGSWFSRLPHKPDELQTLQTYYEQRMERTLALLPHTIDPSPEGFQLMSTLYTAYFGKKGEGYTRSLAAVTRGLKDDKLKTEYNRKAVLVATIELPMWLYAQRLDPKPDLPFEINVQDATDGLLAELLNGYGELLLNQDRLEHAKWVEAKTSLDAMEDHIAVWEERLEEVADSLMLLPNDRLKAKYTLQQMVNELKQRLAACRHSATAASTEFAERANLLETYYNSLDGVEDDSVVACIAELRAQVV